MAICGNESHRLPKTLTQENEVIGPAGNTSIMTIFHCEACGKTTRVDPDEALKIGAKGKL